MLSLPISLVFLIFLICAVAIWVAGVSLAKSTDTIDTRYKLGEAFGGLVLLGITGSLPEIAVTVSAALDGHIPVIIGNLIGGIAIQTLVLVILDFVFKDKKPLSYHAGTPILAIEGILVIFVTALSLLGAKIPESKAFFHINPMSLLVIIAYLVGLYLINKWRNVPRLNMTAFDDARPGRKHHERRAVENHRFFVDKSNKYVLTIFSVASVVTLIAGVLLEKTGTTIANHFGISSGIFAATAIALVNSLPEISTGIESVIIGDLQLAFSDIFGGNAFMPVLFLVADLIAGKPILSYLTGGDKWLGILGIVMTAIYVLAFIIKTKRKFWRLGLDSVLQVFVYIGGMIGFNNISK